MIIHNVQQNTPEWYQIRAGKPTTSAFSKVVTSKGELSAQAGGYAAELAIELFTGGPAEGFEGTDWTERGKELEAQAVAYYTFMNDADVQEVGFVTDDEQRIGCSPDRFIGSDGMLEIKCLKPANHVAVMDFHKRNGRCEAKYVPQTQGQLYVCNREWCDLVFYCPKLPPVIIRQEPDEKFQAALPDALDSLLKQRDEALALLKEYDANERKAA